MDLLEVKASTGSTSTGCTTAGTAGRWRSPARSRRATTSAASRSRTCRASPGLIGLWRASDRVAIVSDTVYFADSARLKGLDYPSVPHAPSTGTRARRRLGPQARRPRPRTGVRGARGAALSAGHARAARARGGRGPGPRGRLGLGQRGLSSGASSRPRSVNRAREPASRGIAHTSGRPRPRRDGLRAPRAGAAGTPAAAAPRAARAEPATA